MQLTGDRPGDVSSGSLRRRPIYTRTFRVYRQLARIVYPVHHLIQRGVDRLETEMSKSVGLGSVIRKCFRGKIVALIVNNVTYLRWTNALPLNVLG